MGGKLCKEGAPKRDGEEASEGKLPNVTIINETGKTILLRDREREVYGVTRYTVAPRKKEKVSVNLKDAGTYYRMAVLVVAGDGKDLTRVEPTYPPLFIDTEDLCSHSTLKIFHKNGKYVLEKVARNTNAGAATGEVQQP